MVSAAPLVGLQCCQEPDCSPSYNACPLFLKTCEKFSAGHFGHTGVNVYCYTSWDSMATEAGGRELIMRIHLSNSAVVVLSKQDYIIRADCSGRFLLSIHNHLPP